MSAAVATAYPDTFRDAPPILVIDTGPTEIQFSVPGNRITPDGLRILDVPIEAVPAYRKALSAHPGRLPATPPGRCVWFTRPHLSPAVAVPL